MEVMKPGPPFNLASAMEKVQLAEDAWNSCDPIRVSLAYTVDTEWRNRCEFICGRKEVVNFLTKKWEDELCYRLKKELWAFTNDRIAVRFEYECKRKTGEWFRSYGNENWEFDQYGLMKRRFASINDLQIEKSERRLLQPN
jgi:nuclear transport factor 2 (NTF2) superfamily protein